MEERINSETINVVASGAPDAHAPSGQNDPELDREFEEMAQLLLEVYLWKLQQERQNPQARD